MDDAGRGTPEAGSPAARCLGVLLRAALEAGASDLHLEPDPSGLRIRMRVDGHLQDIDAPATALVPALQTRIRMLAGVDLAERRLPQDGRFAWTLGDGSAVDIRAAFLPAADGEKIALRLLRAAGPAPSLETIGLGGSPLERLRDALARPNGLVLVAGPTGSGKSTTLYACLLHLRSDSRALATVEDPVEFDVPGVTQVAVDEEVGRSFAIALRALLRQDPDVMMVGEIRDDLSARIACRAALTGHLVLSSLHASDAREALLRLPEIGVADYLVRATVTLVLAQRLVRKLCGACATPARIDPSAAGLFERAGQPLPRRGAGASGCPRCRGQGYRGRIALFEAAREPGEAPDPFGPGSLGAAGLERVVRGETTVAEVLARCPHPAGEPGGARVP